MVNGSGRDRVRVGDGEREGITNNPPTANLTAPVGIVVEALDPNTISRNPVAVQEYINDPLVHDKVSPNYSIAFMDAGDWAVENAALLKCAMLLLHGKGDQITDYHQTEAFANKTEFASIKLYENAYHELHNDICHEEVLKDIVAWLKSRL